MRTRRSIQYWRCKGIKISYMGMIIY